MEKIKEKKYIVGSILCGLLTAFGIVAVIISLLDGSKEIWAFADCLNLVLFALIAWYAFIGYKKAHGNLLKFIILITTASCVSCVVPYVQRENIVGIVLLAAQIGMACYLAGRLAKVKENLILIILVAACRVSMFMIDFTLGNITISLFTPLIIWLDICVAYFLRYKQHREAGLEDAPKK